jgi:hypothetical protein
MAERRTLPPNGKSRRIVDQWMRDIRSAAGKWATEYTPTADLTPIAEVRDVLYTHLLDEHPDLIDQVFTSPIYTVACTWHIVGRDVKDPLEKRGFIFVPNRLNPHEFSRKTDVLMRMSTDRDDRAYIELEFDCLGAMLERQERLVTNASVRVARTKERRDLLQTWATRKSRGRKSRA